jgi:hypothetical protein
MPGQTKGPLAVFASAGLFVILGCALLRYFAPDTAANTLWAW